jgi:hypothetical protein
LLNKKRIRIRKVKKEIEEINYIKSKKIKDINKNRSKREKELKLKLKVDKKKR